MANLKRFRDRYYKNTKSWNFYKGCNHGCIYCWARRQDKRQKPTTDKNGKPRGCLKCYNFEPHLHKDRLELSQIPHKEIVCVAGDSDPQFMPRTTVLEAIKLIKERNKQNLKRVKKQVFYFQSKNPSCFQQYLRYFPDNVILLTTLETNRNYKVSIAPLPKKRYEDFFNLKWENKKVVTVEPLLDFDLDIFSKWLIQIKPLYIYIGYANPQTKKSILKQLKEPSLFKVEMLILELLRNGIDVVIKDLRTETLPDILTSLIEV